MSRNIPSRNSTSKTSAPKTSSWMVPGILVAGTLLLIGAVAARNATMIIVTVLLMAISVTSARGH